MSGRTTTSSAISATMMHRTKPCSRSWRSSRNSASATSPQASRTPTPHVLLGPRDVSIVGSRTTQSRTVPSRRSPKTSGPASSVENTVMWLATAQASLKRRRPSVLPHATPPTPARANNIEKSLNQISFFIEKAPAPAHTTSNHIVSGSSHFESSTGGFKLGIVPHSRALWPGVVWLK